MDSSEAVDIFDLLYNALMETGIGLVEMHVRVRLILCVRRAEEGGSKFAMMGIEGAADNEAENDISVQHSSYFVKIVGLEGSPYKELHLVV